MNPPPPSPAFRPRFSRLSLVGQMGAGKSTVAAALAARWGWPVVDLDDEIARRAGRSIPEIFARQGEAAFRRLERAALVQLVQDERPSVLATGGGAPCQVGAMDLLLAAGPVVWLDAPGDVLAARAAAQGGRPLLDGLSLEAAARYLDRQREERAPFYRRASFALNAAEPVSALVLAIEERLEDHHG